MSDVDIVLAESDREIREADVAKLERSRDAARKKKGGLLRRVLDYRAEHDVGPQPRGPKGRYQPYDEPEPEPVEPDAEPDVDESDDG